MVVMVSMIWLSVDWISVFVFVSCLMVFGEGVVFGVFEVFMGICIDCILVIFEE